MSRSYYSASGTRLPSVTTVIGKFKSSDGLIHWAWKLGIDGKDYRAVRDGAASAGTLTHRMIEADIRGLSFSSEGVDPAVLQEALTAFAHYLDWKSSTNMRPVNTEVSLVSEEYGFGGTFDALLIAESDTRGEFRDRLAVADWKTSKAFYPEQIVQLAAYRLLARGHQLGEIEEGRLVRFSREGLGWAQLRLGSEVLDAGERVFLEYLRAYRDIKMLEKAARELEQEDI